MPLFSRIPFNKAQIEVAISRLEQQTSAELRVYIERHLSHEEKYSSLNRALQVFNELKMDTTKARNGVLIYIAFKDHQCAIIGDQGIHRYVGEGFWREQCDLMMAYFKRADYTAGIVEVIEQIGEELTKYFPIQADDMNELENEVIIND
ncbi:hypothetical protein CFY87_10520 [Actinobacillus seminis]|uniref:Domain of uncharacterized function (DUF477) n=1 Tax=Actinobacillus seminis TaxID=722 RepID=A0A263H9I9_9PAST|nr:TPM domain-containing protein [Actinobacillus seminis]OZN24123.1 hypothetical protein CFY87_10520 [Actinobacillus seminis]SUU34882.1 Domain of uncharacterised function (DUF477) [Actinobacillus seminis]